MNIIYSLIKLKKVYLAPFLFLIFSSCNTEKPSSIFDFERNEKPQFELKGEKYNFKELANPRKIDQKDGFLIIQENYMVRENKPLVHIFQKEPFSHFLSKGVSGEGPGEISDAEIFDPGLSDSTFWINAVMGKKMALFSLNDTSRLSIKEFRQPENMMMAYTLYLTNKGTFMSMMADSPNKLIEFDFDGNQVAGYGEWEQIPDQPEMDNFLLMTYNKGRLKTNAKKNVFVKASLYRDRIEIFDYETKSFTIVDGPRLELPPANISGSGSNSALAIPMDQKYGHYNIAVSANFIFSLYSGYSQQEITDFGNYAQTIYMISFEGKMIAKFNLDRSLSDIAIDESLGKIYGITTDEEPGIAVFDIPKQLLENK
jgi:hypothetical protein